MTTISALTPKSRDHGTRPRFIRKAARSQYSQNAPHPMAKTTSTALTGTRLPQRLSPPASRSEAVDAQAGRRRETPPRQSLALSVLLFAVTVWLGRTVTESSPPTKVVPELAALQHLGLTAAGCSKIGVGDQCLYPSSFLAITTRWIWLVPS